MDYGNDRKLYNSERGFGTAEVVLLDQPFKDVTKVV